MTTTTQLDDFARQVTAGTDAEITSLLQPGQSVHGFEPNAADLTALRFADVVIYNGMGLEPWLDATLESAGFAGELIDASEGIEPVAEAEHDHEGEAEGEHDHEAEAEAEHDHGDENPHVWTSPRNAEVMVTNVAEGLIQSAAADAADAAKFQANADAYLTKLHELDAWITENINNTPAEKRLLVTNHDALSYFNHDYDVTFIGAIIPSWDDNSEPSAAQIDELVAEIKQHQVPAIFTEQQLSPETAEAIASETGAKIYSGDDALYTDALGPAGSEGETYIGSQVHNVTQLVDSWGGQVTVLPAGLKN